MDSNDSAHVIVVGGGYGGITVAKALDDVADVTVIEPRDTFVHHVAALRAVVDPDWIERIFLPYDHLLTRGRFVRDRAVRVDGTRVELASGGTLGGAHVVVATGVGYPYPAKIDGTDRAAAQARLRATHDELAAADRVLLLGAGPVGLEFAGEIAAAWPTKEVIVADPSPALLPGRYPEEFRAEVHRQLDELGVRLLLGTTVAQPPTSPGRAGRFSVAGVDADIWFRCHGTGPRTSLPVDAYLRVRDRPGQWAVGDVTDVPELKMARLAQAHAEVVAANIRTLLTKGAWTEDDLTTHEPAPDMLVLPLGPKGGAGYGPGFGLLGAAQTAEAKGADLFLGYYRALLNLD
ncbi:FAD-dependent oxidoreductase [Dactylosporangium aurantiacum]|uniref:FAD-dependent oxidoreductase n=1 Tax=Dactylosporangium aurantiacum TaxID=35754 RepID=A0A9Q9IQL3_9ACTN|nr:FAD-dependent oxidoreductase [Dactylosporangium aurantiacum]MDG6108540.1 FAD-dependent oxidoreductase [Dactylosporangium aurantiacum]UWZ57208.1 FAD-dependent oxidoreductase [Dactylosporangium aurantiacum]